MIFLLLFLQSNPTYSCTHIDADDDSHYYNLFDQELIADQADLHPFLRIDVTTFYGADAVPTPDNGNVELWRELLPDWSEEEVRQALYSKGRQKLWDGAGKHRDAVQQYMQLALKCQRTFAFRKRDSWDYEDIMEQNHNYLDLIEEAKLGYAGSDQPQLKMRYAYQLIRCFHYSRQYKEATDFFEANLLNPKSKNEMYYYLMDQVAGCYYSLGEYERAAYLFLKVFQNSRDRKARAFQSFDWCTDKGAEGKSHFEGDRDEATLILLKGIRDFTDVAADFEALMEVDKHAAEVELLFMRTLNQAERDLLPKRLGLKEGRSIPDLAYVENKNVEAIGHIAALMEVEAKADRKAFWALSAAYLEFLQGNVSGAKRKVSEVSDERFAHQKEVLESVFDVFTWDSIDAQKESYLAEILKQPMKSMDAIEHDRFNGWGRDEPVWKYLAMEQVSHLYYQQGDLAKSFLIYNHLADVERIGSIELLEDLEALFEKEDKSVFEKMLTTRGDISSQRFGWKDVINYAKGHYYLQNGDHVLAGPLLAASAFDGLKDTEDESFVGGVSIQVFSNNMMECYRCHAEDVMEDEVYLAEAFSFINNDENTPADQQSFEDHWISKSELAEDLSNLESMTTCGTKWKEKLAHYLLGNYYFNVSNTGYYRHVLNAYKSNRANYRYLRYGRARESFVTSADRIKSQTGFNMYGIAGKYKVYHQLADCALEHYEQVLALSTDEELNARTLYMMAKCELNEFYNKTDARRYDGGMEDGADAYKQNFERLKQHYGHTDTYKMIRHRCSYFDYYCSL